MGRKKKNHMAEFDEIFDSLLPELINDMKRLDHRLRTIWREATVCKVPQEILEQEIPRRFWMMVREISEQRGR